VTAKPETVRTSQPLKDMSHLRARRRLARRRRHLFRLDIGIAVLVAVAAVLFGPGVAILAVAALLVVGVCAISILVERWRSRR
jgi:hypothetical protein